MNHHALLIEKTKSVEMGKDTYEKVLFKVNFSNASCINVGREKNNGRSID